jgi:hypothetical protein
MKHLDVSYNVHGNGLIQLSALQPPFLIANKYLKIKEPSSIYSEEEPLLSAQSILNTQLRDLDIPLLNTLLAVHHEKAPLLDDEGTVIVRVDPNYGFGSVTSGFMTGYMNYIQSDYSQQVWLYDKTSDLQTSFIQQINVPDNSPFHTIQITAEDTIRPINGITINGATGSNLTTTIIVQHGTLNVSTNSGANISGNGTEEVVLTGTREQINAALTDLIYTPAADYNGPDRLDVITDDGTQTNTQTISISITPVQDIANDIANVDEDGSSIIDVNDNDSFENPNHHITAINGIAIAIGNTVPVANGIVTLNADGTLSFTPTANYNGNTSFTYTVTSGGTTETATVIVLVNPVNDPPVNTVPGNQSTEEDSQLAITGISVADIDGDILTTTLSVSNGILNVTPGGSVTVGNNGTNTVTLTGTPAQINAVLAGLTYTNTADYHGSDVLTVITTDGTATDTDTINITINPVVDITDDVVSTDEDTPLNIDVNANDSFENAGHTITAINGTAISEGNSVAVDNGSVTLNADGSLNFTPTANYNGTTDFTYTVTSGGTTETATVTVTVNPIDDTPTNTLPGDQTTPEDSPLAITGVSVDDVDGDTLTTTITVTNGILHVATTGGAGIGGNDSNSVTLIGTAVQINIALAGLTYTNTPDYHGPDTLTIVTSDGTLSDSDTIDITVTPVVDITDDVVDTDEDSSISIDVNANDSFENTGHTITAINGTPVVNGQTIAVDNGTVTLNNSSLDFTPTANYNGTTDFTYTVTSGGTTETATVTVTVNPINDTPVNTMPGDQSTSEDTPLIITGISVADIDEDILTTTISVTNGILNATPGGGATINNNGTNTVILTGTAAQINDALAGLIYTNTPDYHGSDVLTVITDDGTITDTDTINISVTSVVDIADDSAITNEDTLVNIDVNANDTFENPGHTITTIDATAIAVGETVAVANGTVTLNANSTLNFTPATNFNGDTSFTYTVTSGGTTEIATVNVTVNPVNDTPTNTIPGAQITEEDTQLIINGITVADVDSILLTTIISVSHGVLTINATGGGVLISDNGTNTVTLSGTAAQINDALVGLAYDSIADYNGPDTLSIITSDGSLADNDSISITVTPVVDINNDSATTDEDTLVNIDVNANDTFENPGHLITAINATAIAVGETVAVANGTVTLDANGTLNFTPTTNFNGDTSFTYTVTSGGSTEATTVNITVAPVNDTPTNTLPGNQTTPEDTPLPIGIISVADVDGDILTTTISVVNGVLNVTTGGGATIGNNGTEIVTMTGTAAQINSALAGLIYTNTADYHGADVLTIVTSDGILNDTDTINITVTPVIDITDDTTNTDEDTPVTIHVNDNDSFEDPGHTISEINNTAIAVGETVAVTHGEVTLNADGTLNFTPTANYNGNTSFTYTVTSGGTTETATVNVTVNPINDTPTNTVPGAQTTLEDTQLIINGISVADVDSTVLTTTISVLHGVLTIASTSGGAVISNNGTNTVTLSGTAAQINDALAGLAYDNIADYNGPDALSIVTSDGSLIDNDAIAISVTPVVDITNDTTTTDEEVPVIIDVNANDSFENAGHLITAINGTAIATGESVTVANGQVTLNADGTLNFTPTVNYNGNTSFNYTVTSGGTTETAVVNITVNPINDTPTNTVPGAQTTLEDTQLIINGISVADVDGDILATTISVTHGTLNATLGTGATIGANGTGTVTLTGTAAQINAALVGLIYTNTADYNGPDVLSVVTDDGTITDTDTINITVTPVVDIANDTASTTENTPTIINVNANDTFENSGHFISAINGTAIAVNGSLAVDNGTVTLNSDGTLNFAPNPGYIGSTSFTYTVTSGGATETATVNVTVSELIPPANTIPGPQTTLEDTSVAIAGVSVTGVNGPNLITTLTVLNGTLNVTNIGGLTITGNGTNTVILSGSVSLINNALAGLTYLNTADYNGSDILTLFTDDGILSDTDSINITITPVVDIANDISSTAEDTAVRIEVNNNDTFENSAHTITAINGTAIVVNGSVIVANGTVFLNSDGSLNFIPTANFTGNTNFTYTVTSGGVTETATVTVTVNPANDAPENIIPGNQTTPEDTPLVINGISVVDVDGDALTTTISVTHGILNISSNGGAAVSNNGTGSVTLSGTAAQINATLAGLIYINTADYNGPDVLTIVTDDGTVTDTDTININITPVVDITNDTASTNEDTPVTIDVNANDSFENPGHTITAINGSGITVGNPVVVANGTVTLNANGTLNFVPTTNFNGSTSFTYTVTSGGTTETATVNVTVNPVNDTPVNTIPGNQNTLEDTPLSISGVSVSDVDGGTLTTTISVLHGTLTVSTGGGALISNNVSATVTITGSAAQINAALAGLAYTGIADYNGTDALSIVTSDGQVTDNDTVTITVTPVVDIANDSAMTNQNTQVNINVNANDSFENSEHTITAINGTAITVGGSVVVANGTVILNANGTLSFTPAANYTGNTSFTYTVTSGGVTETATVNVNVLPFFEGSGQSVLLSTVGASVVPNFEGAYGLSALNPIQGDLPGLISALIGTGGILQGGTTEDALALILSQQGVFHNTDIVQLTDEGSASNYNYKMVFNGSEQMINYQDVPPSALFGLLPVSTQLALLGYNLGDFHDMGGGNLLFSTTGGGVLPSYNPNTGTFTSIHFDNEDVVLATKQPGGYYTYTLFFNGSVDANLDDNLLNIFDGQEFILDGLAYAGTLQNGTMYFSLSNLIGVDLGELLGLDVMDGVLGDGGDVYSIQKVNGNWDISTFNVFFSAADLEWNNELLENALIDLADLNVGTALGDAINALLGSGQVTRYFDIDAIDVVGNTMYFSVSSILNVELIDLLAGVITNPLDPLYPLTFRGENIYTISRANASSPWDKSTLNLFLDGTNYGLGSNSGPLGNVSDNLIEDVNGFSLDRGDHRQNTIMYSTAGGGNEPQLGGSYNGQAVVQLNNGSFYDSFNLAAITNGSISNNNITGIHVLENGNVIFVLAALATLPGGIVANPNDIISWNGQQFSMTFDGSANGLPDGATIESIFVFPSTSINSGKILMTVDSNASLPGTGVVDNQDIIMFNPVTHTYQMVLDGSTLGIQDVGAQLTIETSLSADISAQINGHFDVLTDALADRVSDTMKVLDTQLQAIQAALQPTGVLGGLLSGLLNLVGNLLTTVDNLVNSLNTGLVTNLGATVDSISANLSSLLTSINNNVLTLTLQGVNVTVARNAVNSAIAYVNSTLDGLADVADGVTTGINQLINSLNAQLAVGTTIDLSLYDVKIDALHMLNNGNYLVSFAQELNPELDLNLNLNTAFLNNQALANLNLGVNTSELINDLGTRVDAILLPVLNTTLVADLLNEALSPDLGLIGNNIYRLAQDSQGHWQFSMYFDGADHGLDNGTAADTVLDYVNSLYGDLTLGGLLNDGILRLSSNEDIDALYVFEQSNSTRITGSAASDLLVGTENVNNTFYGGKGNDVMAGNGGANTYEFDAASVNGQHVERDVIMDFNASNGDKLLFSQDIFNSGAAPLENQVQTSFINTGGTTGTLLSITQPGNTTVIHEILLMNYTPPILPPLTEIIQVT